ncbi:MAG: hypothetical protein LBN09_01730 [Clostridioides sp.]|jgi:hypothetical protein|nr:hypothetical protein [Clostridioides sp.]
MRIARLKELLDEHGIKDYFLPPEKHCYYESGIGIRKEDNRYIVLTEERYIPYDISYYDSEEEAVEAFINLGFSKGTKFYETAMKELNQ